MTTKGSNIILSEKQMAEIYSKFSDKVTRYVKSKVFNQQEVDDIVSQVFIKVFSKYDTYDKKKASLSTWIYIIACNTVTDYIRKNSKIHAVLPDSEDGKLVDSSLIEDDTYEHIFNNATLELLADALKKLSEKERDLIVLRYYKKEKLTKIASMMSMSYSNTKIIHNKALAKLENYMKKKMEIN